MPIGLPNLDDRAYQALLHWKAIAALLQPPRLDRSQPVQSGIALVELFAWLTEMVLYKTIRFRRSYETFLQAAQRT